MTKYVWPALAGAVLLSAGSMTVSAAPLAPPAPAADSAIEKVHGDHRSCRRGHRHTRWGEWRSCGRSYSAPGVYLQFGGDRHRHRGHNRGIHRDRGHHRGGSGGRGQPQRDNTN